MCGVPGVVRCAVYVVWCGVVWTGEVCGLVWCSVWSGVVWSGVCSVWCAVWSGVVCM